MSLIEEIKSKINIVDLAVQMGFNSTRNGFIKSIYKDEKNPSLKLYRETNSFFDFSTGRGGDVINFFADYKKISNGEAIMLIAKELGLNDTYKKSDAYKSVQNDKENENHIGTEKCIEIYHTFEKYCNGIDDRAYQYLTGAERGLTEEIINKFRFFYVKDPDGTIDHLLNSFHLEELKDSGLFNDAGRFVFIKHRLIIPYLDDDSIVYLRGRILPDSSNNGICKYVGLSGKSAKRLFNINQIKNMKESSELLVCEGEFDTIRAIQQGYPAVGVPGINNFPENGKELLEKFDIYVCFDNDESGEKGTQEVTNRIGKKTKGLFIKEQNDLTELLNSNESNDLLDNNKVEVREIRPEIIRKSKLKLMTAREIQELNLPEIEWIIKDLIPEGLHILAGKPKIGKSLFALNIALAVANGTKALGFFETHRCKVLYIALEDNKRRIKGRINNMLGMENDKRAPENIFFLEESYDFPKINDGGIDELEKIIEDESELRLIIIDTLGRSLADKGRKDGSMYRGEYSIGSILQELAMKKNISILVLHHTKKGSEEDVFDEISGTTGLTGAMDTMMVIKEKNKDYTLYSKGRDIAEADYKIMFDKNLFCWNVMEKKNEINITAEREEILELIKSYSRAMRTGEIADLLNKEKSNVSKLLGKLVRDGLLVSPKYGYYALPEKEDDNDVMSEGMFD